jgi:hypothetical protein
MRKIICWLVGLLTLVLLFAGCSTQAPAHPTPAGAAAGVNTFIFFYSDN